jgi:transposase-like protein
MGKKSPRKFDLEFKRQAVSLVIDTGLTKSEVARRLDLSPVVIGKWVKDLVKDGQNAFPGKGHLTPEQQEIRQLKLELRRANLEREILKKTIGLFVEPVK